VQTEMHRRCEIRADDLQRSAHRDASLSGLAPAGKVRCAQ
jgi:hypothetical protein